MSSHRQQSISLDAIKDAIYNYESVKSDCRVTLEQTITITSREPGPRATEDKLWISPNNHFKKREESTGLSC